MQKPVREQGRNTQAEQGRYTQAECYALPNGQACGKRTADIDELIKYGDWKEH